MCLLKHMCELSLATHHTCVSWAWQHITHLWQTANGFEYMILTFRVHAFNILVVLVSILLFVFSYLLLKKVKMSLLVVFSKLTLKCVLFLKYK